MNNVNLDKTIAVIERAAMAKAFNNCRWQSRYVDGIPYTSTIITNERMFYDSGYKANLGGLLALAPEWLMDQQNGINPYRGSPKRKVDEYPDALGMASAVAHWLEISGHLAFYLTGTVGRNSSMNPLFKVINSDVQVHHVLTELRQLRLLGESEYIQLKSI